MKKKVSILLLGILVLTMILAGCSNSSKSDSKKKKLVVGTNAEFPPFEYINNDGDVDGFDVGVMKAIGKEMGYDVTFSNMEFKSLTASLKTGGVDAVAAAMTITKDRQKSVNFSESYYTATQCIIVKKNSKIKSLKDLNGLKIGVQEGTTGDLLVTPDKDNKIVTDKSTSVQRFKKGVNAVLELKSGSVDAVVIDQVPAETFVAQSEGSLKYIKDSEAAEEYGIAVAKGDDQLLKDINKGLEKIKENGKFDELVEKYITETDTSTAKKSSNPVKNLINKIKYVFIDTNGYKLLLDGLGVTIGISLAACVLGIVLGFIIALMKMSEYHKGHKTVWSVLANIYINILRGTPVIVQLLIIYMVVFNNHYGILVAIITFGINSGAYVAEIIRSGIMAVDAGQMEGGRSLGFTYGETMRYIILPQAIKNCLPALGNEFVTLIKETSIVGYVAIQDLTKAADFIISRTYETFLPLIAIAIIYYILVMTLTKLLSIMERRLRQSDLH